MDDQKMTGVEYYRGTLRRRRPLPWWRRMVIRLAIWYTKRRLGLHTRLGTWLERGRR
jgi:hypothetical protein